jgi:hypothetical protein
MDIIDGIDLFSRDLLESSRNCYFCFRICRRLALKYHPDKNSEAGAEAAFKELSEAYAVLSKFGILC